MKLLKKIIVVVLFLTLVVGLSGCTNQSPSDSVELYLEQVIKGDSGELTKLLPESFNQDEFEIEDLNSYESTQKFMDILKEVTYTINSESIEGNSAKVNVTINGPDMLVVIGEVFQKIMSSSISQAIEGIEYTEEEMTKLYDGLIFESLENVKYTERTGDITLLQIDNKWEVEEDITLINLLTNIDESIFDIDELK
ncbi:DUF4878 domain-containing protein [Alkalibaculum sporogenes]|nr:DUF4878 domain-containing protein [Alkalibaculum sporogenes]